MNTSSRFAFAVHTLTILAQHPGAPVASDFIAGSVNTNPALIRRLLSMLAHAGITTSQLGTGGGALLAKPAERISLLDVYRAVDEAQLFALHREAPNPACPVGRQIQGILIQHISDAERAMEASLALTSIQDVLNDVIQREHGRAQSG